MTAPNKSVRGLILVAISIAHYSIVVNGQVGMNADGRMEFFALGGDKGVWHKWQSTPNGGWGEWASLGGTNLSQIVVGNNADGRMELFALGGNKGVWHKWQSSPNGGWGEWASLGGTNLQKLIIGKNADGRMELFALGGDNRVWHKWQSTPNGGWGEWASLGGTNLQQITVGYNADGRMELFALGGDKRVWHKWQSFPNGGWGEWASLGGTDLQQIAVGKNADGRMELFALGGNKGVWHTWQSAPNGGWGGWSSLGGTDLQHIAVGKNADGRMELFALGGNKGAWHKWQSTPNGGWGEWSSLGGTDLQQIYVGHNADGRMELFALGGNKGAWHKWQSTPNGGWGEWSSLGGTDLQSNDELTVIDKDKDKIDDRKEQKMLEKFRPYYKFSNFLGEDDKHPADAKWFVEHSELFDHHTEQGTPVFGIERLRTDPSLILTATSIGTSDVRENREKSNYYLNLYNEFREGEPDWNRIISSAVGLYGHVAPLYENPNNLDNITAYKIEYWQFYAYSVPGHEGDWEAVQLVIENDEKTIRTVMHNVHSAQVRFEIAKGRRVDLGNGFIEYEGTETAKPYRGLIGLHVEGPGGIGWAQNNLVRFYCENGDCTHPVVYIEHGGHASWPTEHWSWPGVDGKHNGAARSYLVATPPNLGEISFPNPDCPGADLILHFNGHWGAYGDGPEGPSVKKHEWGKK